jgi:hypothetical protein
MNRLVHYTQSSELEEEDQKLNVPLYSIQIYGEKYLIKVKAIKAIDDDNPF